MEEKAVAIVQVRMHSKRLQGKVLKKLAGKEMLWHVVERLKRAKRLSKIVVATSDTKEDDIIEELALKNGWNFFRGSEHDVLARYLGAAKKFNAKDIVRITGDCPLICPQIVDKCIELYFFSGADYANNSRTAKTFPRGIDIEVFSLKALENAFQNAKKKIEREHVTLYFYHSKPGKFKMALLKASGKKARPDLRLTVDTKEDFMVMEKIYNALYEEGKIIPLEKAIDFLDTRPEIKKINSGIEQKFVAGKQY